VAPTEILAGQHADTLDKLLSPFGVKVALLTGSVKGAARRNLLKNLKNGRIDLVVGTHALFQPAVEFKNLGFVIIDEQHRFGVKQRNALLAKVADEASQTENLRAENLAQNSAGNDLAKADDTAKNSAPDSPGSAAEISALKTSALKSKNLMPHLLTMTATPIPRSLQLTIFGDLDVSILDELPKGRQPIQTKIVAPTARARVDDFLKNQLRRGRQIYIITSQISESQTASAAAETEFKKAKNIFKNFRVGLLHGKLSSDEKDKIMGEFSRHEIDVLVATTVVEVGVDVPNAAAMLILNADHFGLSQLHQLRGRVGRGANQSFCFLMTSDSAAPSQRLREIERSTDGFHLAEVDLKLRGPGEIYGTLQHGSLNLQIANLSDTKTIAKARRAADWFMKSGQNLLQYKELAAKVREFQRLTVLD
jgi:ATP-dependent DNA helicase RecG